MTHELNHADVVEAHRALDELLQRRDTGESLGERPLRDLDPALAAALDEIPDDSPGAHERGRTTLNRTARRLQKLDWRSVAAVTDDFVVLAVDLELSHLDENLRYSVPAALRRQLADRGLL